MPFVVVLILLFAASLEGAPANPLSIVALHRTKPVDFESEILPFLKQSCLACHNQTKAKADLILETPGTILKGGESGPAVVPGKPQESLIFEAASHRQKPFMPPAENKVNAPDLKPEQLALLKLWIEQGASGEVRGEQSIAWRALSESVHPILSLAISGDAQFAACGRGNELFIYQLPTGQIIGPLTDPELSRSSSGGAHAAHLDLVESLDFSPDGELLASGSYREVKFWRRQHNVQKSSVIPTFLEKAGTSFSLVSVAPDSVHIATVSKTHKLNLWNIAESKPQYELQLESAPQALSWLAGEEKIAVATGTNIQIWNHELITQRGFSDDHPVTSLCAAGTELLSGNTQGIVTVWNLDSGERVRSLTNQSPLLALAVSPDGKKLAIAGEDKSVRIWSLADQKVIKELRGEYRAAYRVAQLQRAVAHSTNHVAYRGTMVEKSEKERQAQVDRVRKASDLVGTAQKSLAEQQTQVDAAKSDEASVQKELAGVQAKLKEAQHNVDKTQSELLQSTAALKEAVEQTVLEAKLDELLSRAAAAALASNVLATLKPETEKGEKAVREKIKAAQKRIADSEAALKRSQLTNSAAENELHFAITGAQTALEDLTLAQNNLQLAETDRKQNELQLQAAQNAFTNSFSSARALAFSPDGKMLAASEQNTVTLWSVEAGAPLDTITLPYPGSSVAFSGNDTLLTFGVEKQNGWQVAPPWRFERAITTASGQPAFADRVSSVRFSPDGQFLATGGGEPSRSGEVKIWRVRDGQLAQEFKGLHSDAVLALAYSPDGRYLATGGADRFAKITEAASGKLLRVLEGHTHHVLSLAWKSDGHTVITAGADNLVKVWDAFSGEKKKSPEAFGKEVTAISYCGDTDQALVSSGDATLRLIKENGEKVRTFESASGYLQAALATPDGSCVLAGGQDGVLRLWRADSGKVIAEYR